MDAASDRVAGAEARTEVAEAEAGIVVQHAVITMPSDRLEVPPNLLRPEQELGGREADRDARLAAGKVLVAGEWRAGDRNLEIVYAAQLDPIRESLRHRRAVKRAVPGFGIGASARTARSAPSRPVKRREVLCEERET